MRLNKIYQRHKDDVRFICVYIKEAHPDDGVGGYRSDHNVEAGIAFDQPRTDDDRAALARHCLSRLNLRMPMLLDDMTNQAEEKYVAWPDRLFVFDAAGLINFHSALGPEGFDVDEWEAAIEQIKLNP